MRIPQHGGLPGRLLLCAGLAWAALPGLARAASPDPDADVASQAASPAEAVPPAQAARVAELAEIREQIETLRSRLGAMENREAGLEDQMRRLSTELALQEAQLAEASTALDLASARAVAAQAKVEELQVTLAGVREDLRRRLGGLYRLGREGYLRLFLAVQPTSPGVDRSQVDLASPGKAGALLPAIRQLRYLARRDQDALIRFRATRDELTAQKERLDAEHLEVEAWQARESERRDELAAMRRRHELLLEKVAAERRRLALRADALEEKERKLARLIDSLVGADGSLGGQPIQDFRGALDWPVRGEVVGEFGTRRDPRYRTEVPHNGLDILSTEMVRAVFPGEVLFADHFAGYGRMVVVHHPGRVFTLYAGLDDLRVGKGDVVSLGSVLGQATEQLYFEIRHENQPEDPRNWLR